VSNQVVITVVAAVPWIVAAILGFLATKRSLRPSVGGSPGVSLVAVIKSMDTKVERIEATVVRHRDSQTEVRERLARFEGQGHLLWSPPR
jgi:hypothetical protein